MWEEDEAVWAQEGPRGGGRSHGGGGHGEGGGGGALVLFWPRAPLVAARTTAHQIRLLGRNGLLVEGLHKSSQANFLDKVRSCQILGDEAARLWC